MAQGFAHEDLNESDVLRPVFYIGQHDSGRYETLTDLQYGQVLNAGVSHPSVARLGFLIHGSSAL
jgi:type II protein arginine methyltransferase